jgi:hypothetical protein
MNILNQQLESYYSFRKSRLNCSAALADERIIINVKERFFAEELTKNTIDGIWQKDRIVCDEKDATWLFLLISISIFKFYERLKN